jgi:hypothetical protein
MNNSKINLDPSNPAYKAWRVAIMAKSRTERALHEAIATEAYCGQFDSPNYGKYMAKEHLAAAREADEAATALLAATLKTAETLAG